MRSTSCFIGLLALTIATAISPASADDEPDWRLRVELVDGSRIVGTTTNTSLQVDSGFGELKIPFERISRAQLSSKKKTIRIELNNTDTFSGRLIAEPLNMKTIFGPVKLSMDHVLSIDVVPKNQMGWLPVQKGLVLYYALDDGKNATNRAADKHHGKVTGVKWLEKGQRGGAFEFNGTSRLTVAHHKDLCPMKFTLGAWVCPQGTTSGYQVVMAKTNPGSWNKGYGLVRNSGDTKHLQFFVNYYSGSSVRAEVPSDKWSHAVGVFDGTNLSFYLNGRRVATKKIRPAAGAPAGSPIAHTTTPLVFGGDSSGYKWQGKMDEIVLYNRALSAAEVRRLYETAAKNVVN